MKTVLLIGDSIRMGYEETVRGELDGTAEVISPEENGGTTRNVLAHLDEWAANPDIVHVNCGLHDIKTAFGTTAKEVPLDEYRENVRAILERLRDRTDAVTLWALTTPVNYAWHHERKGFDRFEEDVDAYNGSAAAVANELNVPVNDLCGVIADAGRDSLLTQDGVHFTPEGSELLGKAVAACVRRYL